MEITAGELALACRGHLAAGAGKAPERVPAVCTDTRELKAGEFFAALKGANFDGHDYLEEAFRKGAAGVIVSRPARAAPEGAVVIHVRDTLRALKDIAAFYRGRFSIPFIGITGSSGKTTAREMLSAILSGKFNVLSSQKNYNNGIGLPLTIFRLGKEHSACILEMGMSGAGEIRSLAEIARPETGLITNVGFSHYESFASRDGIAGAKAELLSGLSGAALNMDDHYYGFFRERAEGEVRTFGLSPRADFYAEGIRPAGSGCRFLLNGAEEIFLPVRGKHNVMNALSAVAASSFLGAGAEDISRGLGRFSPAPMRLEPKTACGVNILDDSYNASPCSVAAAAEVLSEFEGGKIFVLGDMLELGAVSRKCHEEAGAMIAGKNFDFFLACGCDSKHAVLSANKAGMASAFHFAGKEELVKKLFEVVRHSDTVLVKGSRSSGMEEVVEALMGRGG